MSDDEMSEVDAHHPPSKKARPEPLSDESRKLAKKAFTTTLSNAEWREIRTRAPLEEPFTRCPRVDPLFKTTESRFAGSSKAKQVDGDLQKIQALVLDVSAPLLELLAVTEPGAEDPPCRPREAVEDAVRMLGNAVGHVSKIRRRRILKACNPDVHDLADNEELFTEAFPNLFGPQFETKMKERAESVKLLKRSQNVQSGAPKRFFRGGRSFNAQRGGGQPYRGSSATFQGNTFRPRGTFPPKKPTQRQN